MRKGNEHTKSFSHFEEHDMLVKEHVNKRNTRTWIACNDDSRANQNRDSFTTKFGGTFIRKGRSWEWTESVFSNISNKPSESSYIFVRPDGIYEMVTNFSQYCEENDLNRSTMYAVLRGQRNHHKGYKVRKV